MMQILLQILKYMKLLNCSNLADDVVDGDGLVNLAKLKPLIEI